MSNLVPSLSEVAWLRPRIRTSLLWLCLASTVALLPAHFVSAAPVPLQASPARPPAPTQSAPIPLSAPAASALDPLSRTPTALAKAFTSPSISPELAFLFSLEAKFAQAVLAGGGKAFATFFAEDGVTLSNKQPPVIGRSAIAAQTTWNAADYQLTWTPQGGQMGPSGDTGFTWGHFEGRSKDSAGKSAIVTGRYMTIWKRQADGEWKVAMDASNEEPPDACTCTTDVKPE